jgi:hypothetical protein
LHRSRAGGSWLVGDRGGIDLRLGAASQSDDQLAKDARDEENGDMSEPENPQEFWENIILDWITKNAGVRKERINKARRFTDEPVNLSVVKVLNMMDDLVKTYNGTYGANLVLSQNWRLTHRIDKIGDFIAAFLEVVTSEEVGRVKKTGIA